MKLKYIINKIVKDQEPVVLLLQKYNLIDYTFLFENFDDDQLMDIIAAAEVTLREREEERNALKDRGD